MSELSNYHEIENLEELPQVPASTVNLFVETSLEARQYAALNPKRTIYWVNERQIGVWFTPLRRAGDFKRANGGRYGKQS